MTLSDARRILELEAEEDPRSRLDEFHSAREAIEETVATAPNKKLKRRYQAGLDEFDQALTTVCAHFETTELGARGNPVFVTANEVTNSVAPPLPVSAAGVSSEPHSRAPMLMGILCGILLSVAVLGFGGWACVIFQKEQADLKNERIVTLERQGGIFIENRRWPEATEAFDVIEVISPESELVGIGRRRIAEGMAEEQSQFTGYWKGEAIASFEAGRWDAAESAARQVLDKYPDETELVEMLAKIDAAKQEEERQVAFDAVRTQLEERKFEEAISSARALLKRDESDEEAIALLKSAEDAKEKAAADLIKAKALLAKAAERDTGEYDEEAMEWLRDAVALAPDDKDILARLEKMAAYTRTIQIPGNVATVAEALATARDRDRLVLAEGEWEGPFVITAAVELQGVSGKTIIRCKADVGSVISVAPGVEGARLSGLTVRHLSFDAGEERFSLAHVRGAKVDFSDCRFEQGSGHGIAVTDGGQAKVVRCRFTENGWNGIAVIGADSLLEAEQNVFKENYQNGIESWDGAAVILKRNTCTGNSRNGIHIDNGESSATILNNVLSGNREFGIVLTSAGSGAVTGNALEKNLLGGMVVRSDAAKVIVKGNRITANGGAGLVLEKGVTGEPYTGNTITGNTGKQFVSGVDLSQ